MTDVIFARLGTLDKYIRDVVMAFWGSPYHRMTTLSAPAVAPWTFLLV
jgi:hypothetical protein